jgi:hypothetical protein
MKVCWYCKVPCLVVVARTAGRANDLHCHRGERAMTGEDYPDEMYKQLADSAVLRFHSAIREGKTEHEAMQEIMRTIMGVYREALAS